MISLTTLMTIIPASIGLCIELAYAPTAVRDRLSLRSELDLNDIVDSLLRTIYQKFPDHVSERRRIVFTSFSPDLCTALNWKQPNYPVFFSSGCGRESASWPSPTALTVRDAHDQNLGSLASAVDFAKSNNLLGVMLEADILVKVPSLIEGMREAGLLVVTWGSVDMLVEDGALDAHLKAGVLSFLDHPKNKLV